MSELESLAACPICGDSMMVVQATSEGGVRLEHEHPQETGCWMANADLEWICYESALEDWNRRPSAWVPVGERLPEKEWPTLLWGSRLDRELDHPLAGRLCSCHSDWVLDDQPDADTDARSFVDRMLGEVTHWLDWSPPEAP